MGEGRKKYHLKLFSFSKAKVVRLEIECLAVSHIFVLTMLLSIQKGCVEDGWGLGERQALVTNDVIS